MKKIYNSWKDTEKQTQEILRQITVDGWRPDYVVGLTRGGLVPANLISQYLGCRMETLKVSFRNGNESESNLWMAEDAFEGKNILIVDDINDSGATLNWIKNDWPSGCLPSDNKWNEVWGASVRIAVLYDNEASESAMPISYSAVDINKTNDPCWVVFPWEDWWKN